MVTGKFSCGSLTHNICHRLFLFVCHVRGGPFPFPSSAWAMRVVCTDTRAHGRGVCFFRNATKMWPRTSTKRSHIDSWRSFISTLCQVVNRGCTDGRRVSGVFRDMFMVGTRHECKDCHAHRKILQVHATLIRYHPQLQHPSSHSKLSVRGHLTIARCIGCASSGSGG